jgi:antagonist of KipI
MSIVIIKPGLLDTIQDLGRIGQGRYGINPGGAMDRYAAKMANILTGNDIHEALIEIHFPGPQILFEKDALVCITGGDFVPTLNDDPIPSWQPVLIRKNTVLQFSAKNNGARVYMSVAGGFILEKWLNSYSTNLKAAIGGWQGRKLEKNDQLLFGAASVSPGVLFRTEDNFEPLRWRPAYQEVYANPSEIFFIKGNEWNELGSDSRKELTGSSFTIQGLSDRMGYQLNGHPVSLECRKEFVSSAVSFGTIQLLPNGQLVILMADHQTTGGYSRIGHVISAHLPKLAQLNAGSSFHLVPVEIDVAEQMLISQHQELKLIQKACQENLNRLYVKCGY